MKMKITLIVLSITLICLLNQVAFAKKHAEQQQHHVDAVLHQSNDRHAQSCSCVKEGLALFKHEEFVPSNDVNSACTGSCGGSSVKDDDDDEVEVEEEKEKDFIIHQHDAIIHSIKVWVGCGAINGAFRGIEIKLTNDHVQTLGQTCGDVHSFTFQIGEKIQGDLVLGSDRVGASLGYLSFSTNQQHSFTVGSLHNAHNTHTYPADGRLLTGVFGAANSDRINRLGFFVSRYLVAATLESVVYPGLSSITTGLTPKTLTSRLDCNDQTTEKTLTFTYSYTTGSYRCWNMQSSYEVSYFNVKAGYPVIDEVNGQYQWVATPITTSLSCSSYSRTTTEIIKIVVPPKARCRTYLTQFDAILLNIRYSGNVRLYWNDSSQWVLPAPGTYSGTYLSPVINKRLCLGFGGNCSAVSDDDDDDFANATDANAAAAAASDDDDDDDANDDNDDDDTDAGAATATNKVKEDELPQNHPNTELQLVGDDDDNDDDAVATA